MGAPTAFQRISTTKGKKPTNYVPCKQPGPGLGQEAKTSFKKQLRCKHSERLLLVGPSVTQSWPSKSKHPKHSFLFSAPPAKPLTFSGFNGKKPNLVFAKSYIVPTSLGQMNRRSAPGLQEDQEHEEPMVACG